MIDYSIAFIVTVNRQSMYICLSQYLLMSLSFFLSFSPSPVSLQSDYYNSHPLISVDIISIARIIEHTRDQFSISSLQEQQVYVRTAIQFVSSQSGCDFFHHLLVCLCVCVCVCVICLCCLSVCLSVYVSLCVVCLVYCRSDFGETWCKCW